jgi:beta-galactosidase GanA
MDVAIAAADFDNIEATHAFSLGLPHPTEIGRQLHIALSERGVATGAVDPGDVLAPELRVLVLPHWTVAHERWIGPVGDWVAAGGCLVLTARCGTHTPDNQHIRTPSPGLWRELAGVRVSDYGRINQPGVRPLTLQLNGSRCVAEHWWETLEPDPGTEAIGLWTSRSITGRVGATRRAHGRGQVLYFGAFAAGDALGAMVELVLHTTGVRPQIPFAPRGLIVTQRWGLRDVLWFIANPTDEKLLVPASAAGGPFELAPRDVRVLRTPRS